jgi:DNA-binding transcriptional MocR family regulator
MSPSHTYTPTYHALKRLLMKGALPGGHRLETVRLAKQLGVSTSPVRDSLNYLAGEGMVQFVAGEGFHVPKMDAVRLEGLLDVNLALLLSAVREEPLPWTSFTRDDGRPADRAATLFRAIASWTGNRELMGAIDALSDRLWSTRLLDERVLQQPMAVLDRLQVALRNREGPEAIRSLLRSYHEGRKSEAAEYARLLVKIDG